MDSPFHQATENANTAEGELLPLQINQKNLLDDSKSSHTEACEDEIPSEISPERRRLGKIQEISREHHHIPSNYPRIWRPTGLSFQQNPEKQWKNVLNQEKNLAENLRQGSRTFFDQTFGFNKVFRTWY